MYSPCIFVLSNNSLKRNLFMNSSSTEDVHTCSVSSLQPRFLLSQCICMPAFALKNNRSPWTAVLPPPFLWQSWWLTAGLTIPFSHHLLAANQVCHPGAIDRAVSLCETCLSKPLYTVVDWVPYFPLCSSSSLAPFSLCPFKIWSDQQLHMYHYFFFLLSSPEVAWYVKKYFRNSWTYGMKQLTKWKNYNSLSYLTHSTWIIIVAVYADLEIYHHYVKNLTVIVTRYWNCLHVHLFLPSPSTP